MSVPEPAAAPGRREGGAGRRRKLTQAERVLRVARERGAHGFDQSDFHMPTVDGGPPIARLASRVYDLEQQGHVLVTQRKPDGFARYVYVRGPAPSPSRQEDSESGPMLFDRLVGVAPPSSPYEVGA